MRKGVLCSLLIAIMSIAICSCNSDNEAKQATENIELTLENYDDYLDISVKWHSDGSLYAVPDGLRISSNYIATMLNSSVGVEANVEGASTNFNYNDVIIKVKVSGTCDCYTKLHFGEGVKEYEFENDLTIDTNIAGNGKIKEIIDLPSDLVTHDYLIHANYEITEISGTITLTH